MYSSYLWPLLHHHLIHLQSELELSIVLFTLEQELSPVLWAVNFAVVVRSYNQNSNLMLALPEETNVLQQTKFPQWHCTAYWNPLNRTWLLDCYVWWTVQKSVLSVKHYPNENLCWNVGEKRAAYLHVKFSANSLWGWQKIAKCKASDRV